MVDHRTPQPTSAPTGFPVGALLAWVGRPTWVRCLRSTPVAACRTTTWRGIGPAHDRRTTGAHPALRPLIRQALRVPAALLRGDQERTDIHDIHAGTVGGPHAFGTVFVGQTMLGGNPEPARGQQEQIGRWFAG